MYSIIVPFDRSIDDIWFTYSIPKDLQDIIKAWQIVKIPFWRQEIYWIVLKILNSADFEWQIRDIIDIYSTNIFLYKTNLEIIGYISSNYFSLIHNSLNLYLPKNLRWKIVKNTFEFIDYKPREYIFDYDKTLNTTQHNIYKEILQSTNNKFMLYGITGSGKTEVYINLINHYISKWDQVLLLVPEIILTNQIFDRIKKVFWRNVISITSNTSPATKTKYFIEIHNGNAKIIVGTRSALFYPYKNLWLIIIDEEHDRSYISDISPRYDAIDVSIRISDIQNIKLVLGSGTPKVTHVYRALKWEFEIKYLLDKYV